MHSEAWHTNTVWQLFTWSLAWASREGRSTGQFLDDRERFLFTITEPGLRVRHAYSQHPT